MLGKALTTAAAGNAAGEATYVEDVFSTYLYDAQSSSFSIVNGIDLDTKGGLVWIKKRSGTNNRNHIVFDSERGPDSSLYVNTTDAAFSMSGLGYTSTVFNSDGFTTGDSPVTNENNGSKYASWTFAKQEKFFDVVTYTGNGTAGHTISHNLGSVPGVIIVKRTDTTSGWYTFHRSLGATKGVQLNTTDASATEFWWNSTTPTDSSFQLNGSTNISGGSYVAYLFAHNDGDGIFGETGDQDIIKCGSYTGNGSTDGPEIDLGFEPQWVMVKYANRPAGGGAGNWNIIDNLRGFTSGGTDAYLQANESAAEASSTLISPTATGFKLTTTGGDFNQASANYIYIAIRRGPMKTPESGTEVFASYKNTTPVSEPAYISNFPVDFAINRSTLTSSDNNIVGTRLAQGTYLITNTTGAEGASSSYQFDYNNGWRPTSSTNAFSWMFRRAPGFFDVVAHTGNGTNGHAISHNLGVAPELIFTKCRSNAKDWGAYALGYQGFLNTTNSLSDTLERGYSTTIDPTATNFYLGTTDTTNESGLTYISYLFATLPGVSKVGSYTGNGSTQTIDCGFSTGARFVLIKRTDSTSNWNLFDTERGIVAGNDPRLELNTTDAEDTGDDGVDPDSSGFAVNYIATNDDDVNVSGATYIFLAIA